MQELLFFFFFKQKTAYEMRISDWSSDVCSSDLHCRVDLEDRPALPRPTIAGERPRPQPDDADRRIRPREPVGGAERQPDPRLGAIIGRGFIFVPGVGALQPVQRRAMRKPALVAPRVVGDGIDEIGRAAWRERGGLCG